MKRRVTNQRGDYVSTFIPPQRADRVRYEKRAVVRKTSPFISLLRELFRNDPNPFFASPIATEIDRRLKIERQAKAASVAGLQSSRVVIAQIEAALGRYLRASLDEADAQLDQLDYHIGEEESFLENLRPNAIKADLERKLNSISYDVDAEVGPATASLARRRIAFENFMADNDLDPGIWWGRPLTGQSIYLVFAFILFDFVLNITFFSDSQSDGIVARVTLAMLQSITTLILGIGFGISYQFSHSRSEGRGWFGRLGAIFLAVTSLYYLFLLTLARLIGETSRPGMFDLAAREIQVHPFAGLLNIPGLSYLLLSIAVIAGVFFKFIDTMGHYPRIRAQKLAIERAEGQLEDIKADVIKTAHTVVNDSIWAFDTASNSIAATIKAVKELTLDYGNVVDQFKSGVRDIEDAARLLVAEVHRRVRIEDTDAGLTLDFDSESGKFDARLVNFRAQAARLQEWDEIHPAALEKCRAEMAVLAEAALTQIEARCEEVGNVALVLATRRVASSARPARTRVV